MSEERKRGPKPQGFVYTSYSISEANREYIQRAQTHLRLRSESAALRLILDTAEQQKILAVPSTEATSE